MDMKKIFPGLSESDPEFAQIFTNFAFGEALDTLPELPPMDDSTRYLAILATLLGCQGLGAFRLMLPLALDGGLTPVEVKEAVYQAAAYLGFGRILPFLDAVNEELTCRGIALPLEPQGTVEPEQRREAGNQVQVEAFGEGLRESWEQGPKEKRHINSWLASNCFGDYYTRKGLSLPQREMITFCFLAAQGGCDPQLTAHARANIVVGNDRLFLIHMVSQCLPYIGYPRSLNALNCIENASK
ncbi:carboxymuconolactone decarboxylase family protein [Acutalibacter muris]|uniref:Carboxymuconolactone decarboxylase n=1 Tax=Acutalibacter muris TaxID=1796620 RepID=A0A1Z2XRF8_9FIRM|nr:carboxymuconolactone decarboxylase family protein [Acutalibacter muris]ANU55717.1 carboxymuconolactone decarboxylase [Hungateiclostridiaceae bacterium KB18]ASB41037.1 carboxymuconolactone decarboxylase [Acutalibacter muris]QQR30318.1 carboxymuconolactone decarboxylase family protein [Acutalibacter muris]